MRAKGYYYGRCSSFNFNRLISWTDLWIVRVRSKSIKKWEGVPVRFEPNQFYDTLQMLLFCWITLSSFYLPVPHEPFLAAPSALWVSFHSCLGPWDHTHLRSPLLGHLPTAPQVALLGLALLLEGATVGCNSKCENDTHTQLYTNTTR